MKLWIFPVVLAIAAGCTACSKNNSYENKLQETEQKTATTAETTINAENVIADETTAPTEEVTYANSSSDMFTNRDYEVGYDENATYNITLSGNTAVSDTDKAVVQGSTITITDEGTYIITGTLDDGMIIVDTAEDDKPQIVFNNVDITSKSSAPIYVRQTKKVFITLAEGTENNLNNGGSFESIDDNNIDAVIFSKEDITFNGSGNLTITSPAGHGIVGKDDISVTSGNYTINCSSHGISANNSVRLANADMTIISGKDGIKAENTEDTSLGFIYALSGTYSINAEGDGISAGSYIQLAGSNFDIVSGGGSENAEAKSNDMFGGGMQGGFGGGMYDGGGRHDRGGAMPTSSVDTETETETTTVSTKGIKADGDILISAGNITINSADDSVHSNTSITIDNGSFNIKSGDDGIHADESLTINEGTIDITESYEGLEALDIVINGGDINITATDDGINAAGGTDESGFGGFGGGNDMFGGHGGGMGGMSSGNGSIVITDGNVYINASGDGIDANGTLEISGGDVTVCGPTQGDTAVLDYDKTAVITGGTFIGTGAQMMAQTFSSSEQGVIAAQVGNQAAGTLITVTDSNGKEIISAEPEQPFQIVILSCKKLKSGETYTLTIGNESAEMTAG